MVRQVGFGLDYLLVLSPSRIGLQIALEEQSIVDLPLVIKLRHSELPMRRFSVCIQRRTYKELRDNLDEPHPVNISNETFLIVYDTGIHEAPKSEFDLDMPKLQKLPSCDTIVDLEDSTPILSR